MTFKDKIYKILKTNDLNLGSVEDIALKTGVKAGTLYKAMGDQDGMGLKNTRILLDKIGINSEWWDTGKGEVFIKKPTPEIKSEQADILDNPLVKNFVKHIHLLEEMIKMKDEEIARLKGLLGK